MTAHPPGVQRSFMISLQRVATGLFDRDGPVPGSGKMLCSADTYAMRRYRAQAFGPRSLRPATVGSDHRHDASARWNHACQGPLERGIGHRCRRHASAPVSSLCADAPRCDFVARVFWRGTCPASRQRVVGRAAISQDCHAQNACSTARLGAARTRMNQSLVRPGKRALPTGTSAPDRNSRRFGGAARD